MQRVKPPFRADNVGSLLRTAALKDAREKHARGEIGGDALTAVEDREIEAVIKKQEAIGLKVVTDGEFRRRSWNFDFLERLPGRSRLPTCCASPASAAARRRIRWSSISVFCKTMPRRRRK
jgi:methionine synthase II (cobalamin-independent)